MQIVKSLQDITSELDSLRDRHPGALKYVTGLLPKGFRDDPFHERPHQEYLYYRFLDQSEDIAGVLPTNSGKSLIYQAGSKYISDKHHGKTIVVSPLISLMLDQVTKSSSDEGKVLRQQLRRGIIALNSRTTQDHPGYSADALTMLRSGKFHLAYVSPERFRNPRFMKIYESLGIERFVIDEMHCVTLWGSGFRYEYKNLESVLSRHPSARLLLLTATSSDERIAQTFSLLRPGKRKSKTTVVRRDIARPELVIRKPVRVRDQKDRARISLAMLRRAMVTGRKSRAVVFTAFVRNQDSRKTIWDCDTLVEFYRRNASRIGITKNQIAVYHAQMDLEERSAVQTRFLEGRVRLLVATKAFGMGVNMPGIRSVIHMYPPVTIEEYYQEIGRGGRDATVDDPCECNLLWSRDDSSLLSGLIGGYWDFRLLECFFLLAHGTLLVNQDDGKLSKRFYESMRPQLISDHLLKKERSIERSGYLLERYHAPTAAARRQLLEFLFGLEKTTKYIRRFRRWLHLHDQIRRNRVSVPTSRVKAGVETNHVKEYMSVLEDHGWVEREKTDGRHGESTYWVHQDGLTVREIEMFCEARREEEQNKRDAWDAMLKLCRANNPWKLIRREL